MAEAKKRNIEKKTIIIGFGSIALTMLLVWLLAYIPILSTVTFSSNTELGGFGDFFWGLGTMLLTGLNVFVFYRLTIVLHEADTKRNQAALNLQHRQFEFAQKMAILNDIRSTILALNTTHEMSEELRSDIYGILNRLQVLRGLFLSTKLEQQIKNVRKKVFYYDKEDEDLWSNSSDDPEEFIPTDNRVIIIAQDLSKLSSIIWTDLDIQFNKLEDNN